jgi:spore coat polysaccharide biosynthesis predicted glycosyltransferase SpsG
MKPLKIVFRVDSNQKIGTGHLLECLRLAKTAKIQAFFCIREDNKSLELIRQFNFPVEVIKIRDNRSINEFETLNELIKRTRPDILIVDLLHFSENDKKKIVFWGAKLVIFNAIFYPVKGDVNLTTVFLPLLKNKQYSGTKYVLLRPGLINRKPKKIKRSVNKILVMFGGSDPGNLTLKTIRALDLIPRNFKIDIVIGGVNIHKKIIEGFVRGLKKGYKIYVNVKDEKTLFKLMTRADLAIASGGYTLCELMRFGIPTIAMSQNITEEEKIYPLFTINSFKDAGRGQRISVKKLSKSVIDLIDNYSKRKILNSQSPKCIDGKGIFRVYDILKKVTNK